MCKDLNVVNSNGFWQLKMYLTKKNKVTNLHIHRNFSPFDAVLCKYLIYKIMESLAYAIRPKLLHKNYVPTLDISKKIC